MSGLRANRSAIVWPRQHKREAKEWHAPHSENAIEDAKREVQLIGLDPLCKNAESAIEQMDIQSRMLVAKLPDC